jgi:desulfoferrodoxin (superoxide reductase-like protein)
VGEVAFGATETPYAEFQIKRDQEQVIAQALCNLHGLWESRI